MATAKKSAKKAAKKRPKKMAKGASSAPLMKAVKGYDMREPGSGASDSTRIAALEHNQKQLAAGLTAVGREVLAHRKVLQTAGLLAGRGKRRTKKGS